MRLLLVLVLIALPLAATAERRVALVFGADRYAMLRPLQNARSDAAAIARLLEDELGFDVTLETDRDLRRMRRALEDFREDGAGADVALVFFAGHGVEIGGENRLLPVDADLTSTQALAASSLRLDEVRAAAAEVAPVVLILVDACRNDPFGGGGTPGAGGAQGGRGAFTFGEDVRPGFGRMGEAANTLFAFAAAPGATAADGDGGNSPFTAALVRYLGTEGVEVRSALTLAQQEVYDRTAGAQLPYVESGLPRLFFAAAAPGPLPERERLLIAMAGLTAGLRAEVERIAAEEGVPLAPLYGALLAASLGDSPAEDRARALREAAAAFRSTAGGLSALAASDPEVARLREAAEARLALGDFGGAAGLLDQAAALDRAAGSALEGRLVERRVSEAASLRLKAGVLRTALDRGGAIAALDQAAGLFDSLAGLALTDAARRDRGLILLELGDLYLATGRTEAARAAFGRLKASALERATAAGWTDEIQHELSLAHSRTGDVLTVQGDADGALAAYLEADRIDLRLASADPGRLGDLAITRGNLGYAYRARGDLTTALRLFREVLDIRTRLAAAAPDSAGARRDLSVSRTMLADILREQGDYAGALALFADTLAEAQALAQAHPGDTAYLYDLAIARQRVGDGLLETGDPAAGIPHHRESAAILRRLAEADPGNPHWRDALVYALNKTGDLLRETGDATGARAEFTAALPLAQALAAADAANAEWQRLLSITRSNLGDAYRDLGRLAEAQAEYDVALGIVAGLANADPGNMDLRRDYAIGRHRRGDVLMLGGNPAAALAEYREAFGFFADLAARDPGNAIWQRDLVIAHVKLAQAGDAPRQNLQAALARAQQMQARGMLGPGDAWMLPELQRMLAATP